MPAPTTNSAPVIVIGGGISGLACAFRLKQRGLPVLLLEQSNRFGGVVRSIHQDGFLFECGPQSFLMNPALGELVEAVGLGGEVLRADRRAPRYVYHRGKLVAAPLSPFSLLGTSLMDLRTKFRLVTEPLRRTRPPEPDESLGAFFRRKFGKSLLENLVGPIVSGVFAGDPEKLSLRSAFPNLYKWESTYGSLVRGAVAQKKQRPKTAGAKLGLCSLLGGVESLLSAIGERLGSAARLRVTVTDVQPQVSSASAKFSVRCRSTGSGQNSGVEEILDASAVVVATETAVGGILSPVSPQFPALMEKIPYAAVAVVAGGYRREAIGRSLDGFGFLVPRKEGLRVLGTVWNSSLFPGRAPEGHVVLTSFAGGATDPEICTWSENRIADTIHGELARVLEIREAPVARHLQIYARALPQYNLGHGPIVAALEGLCEATPGLFLAGNYLEGPSLGACVERAFQIAEKVETHLGGATSSI